MGAGSHCDVSVLTSVRDVADARLHRFVAAFRRAGLTVEVHGFGPAQGGPPGATVLVRERRGARARMLADASLPFRAAGRVLFVLDPDLVPAAAVARTLRRRPLVVDLSEDYLPLLADRAWARSVRGALARALVRASTALSRHADVTVVADEHVPPARARSRQVVRNLPDGGYLPPPGERDPQPRAVYVGDLRASRGLWTMLEAVSAAPGWRLDLVGPVADDDRAAVAAWLAGAPAADRVAWHGRLPPARAWAVAAGAWCGLALLDDTPAFRAAMPSKLYEYLGCGLAVVTSALPRPAALVRQTGAGAVADGAAEVADVLRRWAARPDLLDAARSAARRWAADNLAGASAYDDLAVQVARLAGR